jgi:phospholipid/cholesterol/gamma-HCH transport system substrate-binding protein
MRAAQGSTELRVGIFALLVLILLSYMTFRVGGFDWLKRKEGYTVYVYFRNIAGLDAKTRIKVAGVDAGIIERIELVQGRAKLTLRIYPQVKLYSDATATVRTTGLLGEKYLELEVGSQEPPLKDGDTIKNVKELVDVDELMRDLASVAEGVNTFTERINQVLAREQIEDMREAISNLKELTARANTLLWEGDKRFREALEGINALVKRLDEMLSSNQASVKELLENLRELSASLKEEAPQTLRNLRETSSEVKALLQENRPQVKSILQKAEDIATRLQEGQGTLGKLLKDERLYEKLTSTVENVDKTLGAIVRFRTFLTFQGRYLSRLGETKGQFFLTLQPREDKYYVLGITADPLGRTETETVVVDGETTTQTTTEQDIEFTALFVKRFHDTALKIGLMESTFGLGLEQFLLEDRLRLSIEAWDFGTNEEGAERAHLSAGADYFLFKHLFLSAGMDNILNSHMRGFYMGAGLRFEDEDFKYIFGSVPSVPGK